MELQKINEILEGIRRLESKTEKANENIEILTKSINKIEQENVQLKERVVQLEKKVDYFENQSRRNNLVIYGLKETKDESWNETEDKATAFVKDKFGITLQERDIERAHRLGTNKSGNQRPVIIKFNNYKVKERILRTGGKLKDTGYAVAEDFSKLVKEERNQLKPFLNKYRQEGRRAHLRFNKLSSTAFR